MSPMPRAAAPVYAPPLEYKIHEINQRLRNQPEMQHRWWWDSFALEFFDDMATMIISFCTEDEREQHFSKFGWFSESQLH